MVRSHFACGSRRNRVEGFDTRHMGDVDLCLPPIGSEPPERAGLRGLRSRRRVVLEAIDLYLRKLTGSSAWTTMSFPVTAAPRSIPWISFGPIWRAPVY